MAGWLGFKGTFNTIQATGISQNTTQDNTLIYMHEESNRINLAEFTVPKTQKCNKMQRYLTSGQLAGQDVQYQCFCHSFSLTN